MANVIQQNESTFFHKKFISRSDSHILIIFISKTHMLTHILYIIYLKTGVKTVTIKPKVRLRVPANIRKIS